MASPNGQSVPPKWLRAAIFLATGMTVSATVRKTGVPRRTLDRWIRNPKFERVVSTYRKQYTISGLAILARHARKAAKVIVRELAHPEARIRLLAAREVFAVIAKGQAIEREIAETAKAEAKATPARTFFIVPTPDDLADCEDGGV